MFGKIQRKPKRISFCVDVSSSMSVMNSDGRLDRVGARAAGRWVGPCVGGDEFGDRLMVAVWW